MDADLQPRHAAILAEVVELAMAAARELGAALPEASTPQDKACLATALNRTLRGVRQSLALEARLKRDAVRDARDARSEDRAETGRRIERRKARLGGEIERVIWNEYEEDEAHALTSDLVDRLTAESLDEAFLDEPLAAQVARICDDLGIPVPDPPLRGRWPEGPEGVAAHEPPNRPASQPPQSLRDSSPSGGAPEAPASGDDLEFDASG